MEYIGANGESVRPYPFKDVKQFNDCAFNTLAVAAAHSPDPKTGALISPIYLTSTYEQDAPGIHKGYDYSRCSNPSYSNVEQQIAALEHGEYGLVYGCGLSALTCLLSTLKAGDKVSAVKSCYGGTYRLLSTIFQKFGIEPTFVHPEEYDKLANIFKTEKPKLFFFESPTNPLLEAIDIERIASVAREFGVKTVFDNTFATPYHQSALQLGVDIVMHSCTKYLAGHSDVMLGAIITNDKEVYDICFHTRKCMGLQPSPFDSWLVCRSIKSLGPRMQCHSSAAFQIAKHFEQHSFVSKVYYPGLLSSPTHEIAKKQMKRGFGAMISMTFKVLHSDEIGELFSYMKLFHLAESLGGVLSLVCQPSTMTHKSIPAPVRKEIGLDDGLVRFSIGVEDPDDLINDIEQAIKQLLLSREKKNASESHV